MAAFKLPECLFGEQALARGAWAEAREAFEAALLVSESPEGLEGLGTAAWWLDLAELVFESRERAYRLYVAKNQRTAAARVAVWLGWDYWAFRGESAVANGWLQRARRLLESEPASAEHAWLEVRESSFCLLEYGDPERALSMAREGIRVARQVGSVDLEMLGIAVRGLVLVASGSVREGMCSLDEVNAAVIAGELTDRVAIGMAGCYLIAACERVHDYDRALQWCKRLKSYCTDWGLRPLFAVCRTQYASICLWRGTWLEAEEELRLAADELAASRPAMTVDAWVRLGELRRRQGRLSEAEVLFQQCPKHGAALLGRAGLAMDRGDYASATENSERYLRQLPVANRMGRAAALELLVCALSGAGECQRAEVYILELSSIAESVSTLSLRASASFAAGCLAAAQEVTDTARRYFEDAVDFYAQSGAPFETGRARLELARCLSKLGRKQAANDEARLAMDLFEGLVAEFEIARVRHFIETSAATQERSANARSTPNKGTELTNREMSVLRLVSEGLNNQCIAKRLFLSDHTVHRHMANILNKLNVSTRAAAVAHAARRGLFP
jgi:LuxR family transcriptional regulator, maltose regulon positive regulatory protein